MNVTAVRRNAPPGGSGEVLSWVQREQALCGADFVVASLPGTARTAHCIDGETFAMMRPSTVFINVVCASAAACVAPRFSSTFSMDLAAGAAKFLGFCGTSRKQCKKSAGMVKDTLKDIGPRNWGKQEDGLLMILFACFLSTQ